jgi:polyhydroxybutyrate depolymerase
LNAAAIKLKNERDADWEAFSRERERQARVADALKLPGLKFTQPVKLGETDHVKIKVDGEERDVYLHLPSNFDPEKPMPLMIIYNGLNTPGGAGGMEKITELGQKADEKGFAVAYLQGGGMKGGWNNGQLPFDHQNDVKFTEAVIDTLQADLNIDKDRTYLVGISWGGSMMHRALSQLSGKVAAGADVAGFMTGDEKWPTPSNHVSEISIHSKDDQTVYYQGRTGWGQNLTGFHQEPVPNTFNFYRHQNGILSEPTVTTMKAPDGSNITIKKAVNPDDGTEVELMTLEGVKHGWPGSYEVPNTIRATDVIVDFLLRHSRGH